jgi:hypothetical protein
MESTPRRPPLKPYLVECLGDLIPELLVGHWPAAGALAAELLCLNDLNRLWLVISAETTQLHLIRIQINFEK